MIVEFFLGTTILIIEQVWAPYLPEATALGFLADLTPLFGLLWRLNAYLPIDAMLIAAGGVLAVRGLLFGFLLVRQVWRFVPVIGGG